MNRTFSVIGCEHGHIDSFFREMLQLGYACSGIYEPRNHNLARAFSDKYNVPLATDIEACLGPSVQFVGCAAINNEKIGIIELCEQRGKHIMVDKPAVTNANGLARLEKVIGGGKIQVGLMLTSRFEPSLQTLKRHLDDGELGDIVHISMQKPHRLTPQSRPPWFFSREQNGGIIVDLLIHDFDLLRWLTGKSIRSVQGYAIKNILPEYPDFFDTTSMMAVMEGNAVAQLYADWHTPDKSWTWGDARIFVTGTKGKAEVRACGDPLLSAGELVLTVTNDSEWSACPVQPVLCTLTEDFVTQALGTNDSPMISHRDILMASSHAIEAARSAQYLVS